MRSVARLLGHALAMAALVAGVLSALSLCHGLLAGETSARRLAFGLAGVALAALVMRFIPARHLLGGYAALAYAFLFAPILVVVVYAFNGGANVASFESVSLRWFARAISDETITSAIARSLQVAVASAVVSTVLGTAAALALVHARPRARTAFDSVVFLTLAVPEIVIAISLLVFFVNAGFELGLLPMALGHSAFGTSLVMLIVRARLVSMGPTLLEASNDLGAGPGRTFAQITLPLLAPALMAGGLLAFTLSFDDVVISQFASGAGNQTWPLRVLTGLRFGLRPDLNAAATLMLAFTLASLAVGLLAMRQMARRADLGGTTA